MDSGLLRRGAIMSEVMWVTRAKKGKIDMTMMPEERERVARYAASRGLKMSAAARELIKIGLRLVEKENKL